MRSLSPDVRGPRAEILELVGRMPGIHLRGVEHGLGLALGQVVYHLDRLERMGLVSSVRDGGFRRFFPAGVLARGERQVVAALRHGMPRRIVGLLLDEPGLSHKELLARLDVAGSTLSFHLQHLVEAGVVERDRVGVGASYRVVDPASVASLLARLWGDRFGGRTTGGSAWEPDVGDDWPSETARSRALR